MQLILVRHGEAEHSKTADALRELTARGRLQAKWAAADIATRYEPNIIISSPLVRAQQTAQAIYAGCPQATMMTYDGIKPDDDASIALEWLSLLKGQCIVVVCHMNIVSYLEALLLDQPPRQFELAEYSVLEQTLLLPKLSHKKYGVSPIHL